jgi:hypothetical protein
VPYLYGVMYIVPYWYGIMYIVPFWYGVMYIVPYWYGVMYIIYMYICMYVYVYMYKGGNFIFKNNQCGWEISYLSKNLSYIKWYHLLTSPVVQVAPLLQNGGEILFF